MSEMLPPSPVEIEKLTKELATAHIGDLVGLANQIPGVKYTAQDVLADHKGPRDMHGKWDHSLAVFEGGRPIGLLMAYEREAEGNEQYPENTLYLSELAVSEDHRGQGIAKDMLRELFTKSNNESGFQVLSGELNYSVQTNSADWNSRVVELYESFGFKKRATKEYPNRTDVVLGAAKSEIKS